MAIYYDPNYAAHVDAWKSLGARHFADVGPAGDWKQWLGYQDVLVVSHMPEGIDFTTIAPQDGQRLGDGPLDKLLAQHDANVSAQLASKEVRAEEQRREAGVSNLSDETVAALKDATPEAKPKQDARPSAPAADGAWPGWEAEPVLDEGDLNSPKAL